MEKGHTFTGTKQKTITPLEETVLLPKAMNST